jgi:hypothetical protein
MANGQFDLDQILPVYGKSFFQTIWSGIIRLTDAAISVPVLHISITLAEPELRLDGL